MLGKTYSLLAVICLFASLSIFVTARDSESPFPTEGVPGSIDPNSINAIDMSPNETHVQIVNPSDGTVVKGLVRIDGVITGVNVSSVFAKVDDGGWTEVWNATNINESLPFPGASVLSREFTYFWNSSQYSDGVHTIYVRAYSATNGYSEIRSLNLTVQNSMPQKPDSMWLWFGIGFFSGGISGGVAGILLRKRRISRKQFVAEDTKTS